MYCVINLVIIVGYHPLHAIYYHLMLAADWLILYRIDLYNGITAIIFHTSCPPIDDAPWGHELWWCTNNIIIRTSEWVITLWRSCELFLCRDIEWDVHRWSPRTCFSFYTILLLISIVYVYNFKMFTSETAFFHTMAGCSLWFSGKWSPNGDQSGQWGSISERDHLLWHPNGQWPCQGCPLWHHNG